MTPAPEGEAGTTSVAFVAVKANREAPPESTHGRGDGLAEDGAGHSCGLVRVQPSRPEGHSHAVVYFRPEATSFTCQKLQCTGNIGPDWR